MVRAAADILELMRLAPNDFHQIVFKGVIAEGGNRSGMRNLCDHACEGAYANFAVHFDPNESLVVQSFDPQALRDVTRARPDLARTFLFEGREAERWLTVDGLREVSTFATGIGPGKLMLDGHPDIVRRAHEAGLTVTPYTFTTRAPGRIADVAEEMRYYLEGLGVDALFTDNPDRAPRQRHVPASR